MACIVNTNTRAGSLQVRLREAMDSYRRRTGERMTYEALAKRTGLSRATIESLASRDSYNTRLSTIEKVCHALGCEPGDLLVLTGEGTGRETGGRSDPSA